MVARTIAELDGARCACPPTRHTAVYLVELVCMSCARPVATLRARTPRARVLLPRQPRCQVCGGAAVVGDLTVSPNTEKRPGADGLKAAS